VSGKFGSGQGTLSTLWLPALGIPLLIVLGIATRRAKPAFDDVPGSLQALVVGLGIFGLGAFAMEPITSLVLHTSGPAFVWIEETLEMLGVTFLLWSAFALAEREGVLAFAEAERVVATAPLKPRLEAAQD
jgi:hypothetical protein